jgi:predicted nucleotidyltransferase
MIEASRSELIDLCDRYGVRRLALFGSALRDDFDPGRSDLDLLVEFSPTSPQEHAEAYFGLLEDLESLFGRRVDLLELGAVRNPYLRREIEEQQETLYAAA